MVIIAIVALVAGILCGHFIFPQSLVDFFSNYSDYVLYILMFSVGISVGLNKSVFKKIKEYHIKIFLIPAGIICGSILAGFVCSQILGTALNESMAVVSRDLAGTVCLVCLSQAWPVLKWEPLLF